MTLPCFGINNLCTCQLYSRENSDDIETVRRMLKSCSCYMVRDPGRFQRGEMFDKISGSPQYMAPELVGQRYDYRVDMRLGQALRPCFPFCVS